VAIAVIQTGMGISRLVRREEHPGGESEREFRMNLSCPQCGLVLALRGPQIEYCPRCIARRRQPVPLVAEVLKRVRRETPAAGRRSPAKLADRAGEVLRRRSST
jgi:hypothetical protein